MKKGSILIVALWTLFFLSALALAIGANVSASLKLATRLNIDYRTIFTARAGIERAIMAISGSSTNELSGAGSEYWSMENTSLDGCTFSVTHTTLEAENIATNYGVVCESTKYNINNSADLRMLLDQKLGKRESSQLMVDVRTYWKAKKKAAEDEGRQYYKFRVIEEFMLVEGVTSDIFIELRPYITVYESTCYGGTVDAYDNDNPEKGSRVDFVYDKKTGEIVYWRQ